MLYNMEDDKKSEKSVLKVFDKFHNPTNESSEAEALELLSQLPNPAEARDEDEDQFTLLHHACYNGWFEVSKILIEKYNSDPNCRNAAGSIPLRQACLSGNLDLVKYLILDKGCDPNDRNNNGNVALHNAALGGHLDVTKFLIEHCKIDSALKDNMAYTTLHLACEGGHLNLIKYLIEEQACNPACKNQNGRTPLHRACLKGHLEVASYLIKKYQCNPSYSDNYGWTPLHNACEGGHLNLTKYLIEEQACNPACKDQNGRTALHLASMNGHMEVATYLIKIHQCNPNCSDNLGWMPLHNACEGGHLDLTKYFIEQQACNPACKNQNGRTPLHRACLKGHMEVATYLIKTHQCNPSCSDSWGWTPLHNACEGGYLNLTKYLIEEQACNPACKNQNGRTPLHRACLKGHMEVATYLIEMHQCNSSYSDNSGRTPLHSACEGGNLNLTKYLIEEQACNPASKSQNGETPLHRACLKGHMEVATYLIETHQCNPRCSDNSGRTPLHSACEGGHLDLTKYLIKEQACNPDCKSQNGEIPLHRACLNGYLEVANYLIKKHQCNPSCSDNYGWMPLHNTCEGGHLNLTKYLIEEQACNPACKNQNGRTPLHRACLKGHLEVANYLIKIHQCNPSCSDNYGWTPLHFACEGGHLNLTKYLIEEQACNPVYKTVSSQTPLHSACLRGHLHIAKYLIEEYECDPICKKNTGETPLHFACKKGHLNVAKYLIEECNCDPTYSMETYSSPLSLACSSHRLDLVKYLVNECSCNLKNCNIKLSDTFVKNDTDIALFLISSCEVNEPNAELKTLLLHPAFKVFVMGNFSSGKSTLVKALQEHFLAQPNTAQKLIRQYRNVSDVSSCTAGIVSIDTQVPGCGRVIIYDFAGQAEYYSSHAALCENLMTSQGCLIIIVFNLSKALNECVQELHFWQLFINIQVRLSAHYPSIMFVASHTDIVKAKGLDPTCEAKKVIQASFGEKFRDQVVFLDCRQKYSPGLQTISDSIKRCCSNYQAITVIESKVHLLHYLIKFKFKEKVALLLENTFQMIASLKFLKANGQLPKNINELSDLLAALNQSGEIIFLKNDANIGKSWVILAKDVLLNEINGTIFAPKGFKNHHDISNSTGVVPLSNIRRLFPHHDPQMLIGFMMYLELCHEISTSEADLISKKNSCPTLDSTHGSESFYFFPALVKVELSNKDFLREANYYKYGWCLQRVGIHQCLTSRFLHTILLRLAFTFALHCKQNAGSIVLQRKCNIWKNGIHWVSNNGVEVVVEVVEQSTAVVVVLGCSTERNVIKCLQLRSAVVHMVLEKMEQFCGELKLNEYVIDPDELKSYPLSKNIDDLFKYSMKDLAMALKEQKEKQDLTKFVTDQIGETFKRFEIEKLLYFEPYSCLSDELIHSYLYRDDEELNTTVSDSFLLDFATTANLKSLKLKEILPLNESELAGAVAQCDEQYKADRRHQCFLLLRTWRDSNENTTYSGLRELLDSCSIFCGRNPLGFVSNAHSE